MRLIFVLIVGLAFLGIFGTLGGVVMLGAGYWLSKIDALGISPFQAAAICTGVAIVFAIIINQLLTSFLFPPFTIPEDEEEENESPVRIVRRPKKRR